MYYYYYYYYYYYLSVHWGSDSRGGLGYGRPFQTHLYIFPLQPLLLLLYKSMSFDHPTLPSDSSSV